MKAIFCRYLASFLITACFGLQAKEPLPASWDDESQAVYALLVAQLQNAGADYFHSVDTLVTFAKSQNNPQLYAKAYKSLLQVQRYEDALDLVRFWQNHQQKGQVLDKFVILALALNHQTDKAVNRAKKMLRNNGQFSDRALNELISLLVGQWYHPGITVLIEHLYQIYGDHERLALTYVNQQHWQGRVDKAVNALDKLIFKSPKNIQWRKEKANLYRYNLQLKNAEAVWTDLLRDYPGSPDFQFAYAQFLYDTYQYKKAEDIINRLEKNKQSDEDFAWSVSLLSLMNKVQLEHYQDAEQVIKQMLTDGNYSSETLDIAQYTLAEQLLENKQFELAKKYFEALATDSQFAQSAAIKLGQIYYKKSLENGHQWFADFPEKYPVSPAELVQIKATTMQEAEQTEAALSLLKDYLAQHPENEAVRYLFALVAAEAQATEQAVNELKRLYATTPESVDYQNALGYTLLNRAAGDKIELKVAEEMIKKALFSKPGNPAIIDSMGWLYYQQGHYELALPYFRYAYANYLDGEIIGHYIVALFKAGKTKEAQTLYQLEKQFSPNRKKIDAYTQTLEEHLTVTTDETH